MSEAEAIAQIENAFRANDAAQVGRILDQNPELKKRLNDPLPHGCFGTTPLLAAVQRGSRELVDVLLQAGADINARSHWWAGSFGVLDHDNGLADFLIERGAIVDIHAACRLNRFDRVKELIAQNPELVHARGGDGQTPLHFAANVRIAEFLLDHGADINAIDVDHESTPAQYMIRDRQEVARFLIERGCQTDLLMLSALGDLERVRKLLDEDPEQIRMSVSEISFPKKNPKSGGTIYIWTLGRNKTAPIIAHEFGHKELLEFLIARSPDDLKLSVACDMADKNEIQSLLARDPGLKARLMEADPFKLPDAARDNKTATVAAMLDAGWSPSTTGQHGGTALHWAAFHGNAEMVRIILRFNPPLELRDHDYHATPLEWAIHGSENGWHATTGKYGETVTALLQAGAKQPDQIRGTDAVRRALQP